MNSAVSREAESVCPNIGPREIRLRNTVGVIGTAATLALLAWLLGEHAPRLLRLLVVLPAYVAAAGFFQARAQTCVAFARQGIRVLGDDRGQAEKVTEAMRLKIKQQARQVMVNSTVAVAIVTALALALP